VVGSKASARQSRVDASSICYCLPPLFLGSAQSHREEPWNCWRSGFNLGHEGQIRPYLSTIRRRFDFEIIELLSGFKLCVQPAGLFPAARPRLRWSLGISILGMDLRITASRFRWHLWRISLAHPKLAQMLLKPFFFSPNFASQYRGDHLMQGPKLVDRHGFEVEIVVHLTNSDISSVYHHRAVDPRRARSGNLTESRQRRQCRMRSRWPQGAGFLMPKANRVHCTPTTNRVQNSHQERPAQKRPKQKSQYELYPCRLSTGRIIAPRTSSRPAITRLTARRMKPTQLSL